jgi:hypothetical protein
MTRRDYEPAPEYDADAYAVTGYKGIAWHVLGHETEPLTVILCPDCEFHAVERPHGGGRTVNRGNPDCDHERAYYDDEPEHERTGHLVCVMIGDDQHHAIDPDDLTPLKEGDYCPECGQVGCRAYR